MTLTPGTRLGPYEITAPLGAGGMGEVYRAKDTRLGRDVAVKVLPPHLSASADMRARFEREARAVSSLNHPHICVLHDVGREGDTDFLVMELIEGETLAQRIAKGALPAVEVARLGAQIADALARAHRAGVVHRDLKPGNVMLAKAGAKLLDFGLARGSGPAGPISGSGATMAALTQSPTMVSPLTAEGAIVGTFQYMAPEQLEGKEADARADLWSLGCVLYEMATGRRAFDGASQASLISSIMKDDPRPMTETAPLTPPPLDRLVRECLAKDPDQRIQSAHDVKLQLDWIRDAGSQAGVPAPVAQRRRGRERLAWVAALSALVLVAAVAVLRSRGGGGVSHSVHAAVVTPAGVHFSSSNTTPIPLAISPDGTRIVFCARKGEAPDMLWVRTLNTPDARSLVGTEKCSLPFFSPDGGSIGFFADGKLKRVDVAGGPVVTLADALEPRGGTWGRDGTILFAPGSGGPILRVSADGGSAAKVTALDSTLNESTHRYPHFLPDGRHFLYLARRTGAGSGVEPSIYAASLGTQERKRIVDVASNVLFASGHLVYARGGILMAQPFDPGRLATTGPAVPVVEELLWDERFSRGVFAASQNGVLVCMTGKEQARTQLAWLDRTGREIVRIGEAVDYTYGGTPALSPDGSRAAMAVVNPDRGSSSVWIVDLASGRRRRLTVDEQDHPGCAWSHDGKRVFVNTGATYDETKPLLLLNADGSGADSIATRPGYFWPASASPDGRFVLSSWNIPSSGSDLMVSPLAGQGPVIPLVASPASEDMGQFSPDGRFVVYASNESGRAEVYVTTFPQTGGRWQVSQDGGSEPRWNRDGKELFYIDRENRIVSVEVLASSAGFEAGSVRPLFQLRSIGWSWRYDVSPDGSRFLVMVLPEDETQSAVTLITDWTAKLRKR